MHDQQNGLAATVDNKIFRLHNLRGGSKQSEQQRLTLFRRKPEAVASFFAGTSRFKGLEFISTIFECMPQVSQDIASAEEICLLANEGSDDLVKLRVGR